MTTLVEVFMRVSFVQGIVCNVMSVLWRIAGYGNVCLEMIRSRIRELVEIFWQF